MKLSDYVADFLVEQKIKHVFGLTGGAAVHLFDSIAKRTDISPVFNHHEQASAFAAEAYSRYSNNLGAAIVTTGPGGTNAITGVTAAWLDSLPCIYISGQTRYEHTTGDKKIRQLGSQQLHIISLVKPITKYAVMLEDPKMIKYHLQKAVYLAKSRRPGPVWIDIPLNYQWAEIEPGKLPEFNPAELKEKKPSVSSLENQVKECLKMLKASKRPVILVGYGVRLAHAEGRLTELIKTLGIPYISSWTASDLMPTDDENYMGRPGIAGQRGANLAMQNSDLLICLGSHLSIPIMGTDPKAFAREAKKIVVDIDKDELSYKEKIVHIDLAVNADVNEFLGLLIKGVEDVVCEIGSWNAQCAKYKKYNQIPAAWADQKDFINPYVFIDSLSKEMRGNEVVVIDGGGTVTYNSFQSLKFIKGQRVVLSCGLGSMGSGLPESIGACFAAGKKRTICLCGDGSMQLNIQELQTIAHHKLPIKIFVFNNQGYLAIKHTQNGFLGGRHIGSSSEGGMSLPDYIKVAEAYGIRSIRAMNHKEMAAKIKETLDHDGPALCEIMISPDQQVIPSVGFEKNADGTNTPRPLEDMYPYLDRKEFLENMIVKPLDVSRSA